MRSFLLLFLVACSANDFDVATPPSTRSAALLNAGLPPTPALSEDVSLVDEVAGRGVFARPHIPPYRTTRDGRVGLDMRKTSGDVGFYLFAPEKSTGPWRAAAAGVTLLASTTPLRVGLSSFYATGAVPSPGGTEHRTICDAWPTSTRPNPYPCASNSAMDCYDVTIVSGYPFGAGANKRTRLYGRLARITVRNPKRANASIVSVETNEAALGLAAGAGLQTGPDLFAENFFEPTITEDGRLLVGRIADTSVTWVNPEPGSVSPGRQIVDVVYSVYDETAPPCDVTRWTALHPITHAHYDRIDRMSERYGFAHYPLRDPEGAPLLDGVDLHGSYPWIDRRGTNLFFTTTSNTLFYDQGGVIQARYVESCVDGVACTRPTVADLRDKENTEDTRGIAMAGLWTHGKMVLLDGILNNTDYGLARPDLDQRTLQLYSAGTGSTGTVRVGTGRDNGAGALPAGATPNTAFIDSIENRFNHRADFQPATVRDVVWVVSAGKVTTEVAFDDYLDPRALIVSDMVASMSHDDIIFSNQMRYHDGFTQTSATQGTGFDRDVRVQNAATAVTDTAAPLLLPPTHGDVLGGARIEPVSLGGIYGKGVYLDGVDDRIEYAIPTQPSTTFPFYIGLFIDTRATNNAYRTLISFPNGGKFTLNGNQLRYVRPSGANAATIALPVIAANQWRHLGFVVENQGRRISLYVDGFFFHLHNGTVAIASLSPAGVLAIGAASNGVQAWVDELKVLMYAPSVELMCNHARGSLVKLEAAYSGSWSTVASAYPASGHNALASGLGHPVGTRYACLHDYSVAQESLRLLQTLPANLTSMRAILLGLPDLRHGVPRPDSSANVFCTSCHITGERPSLGPEALLANATNAELDPRRQPLQPPPLLFGVVPVDYYGVGLPGAIAPPVDGLLQDLYVLPP
jgi:hypothetical protein